MSGVEGGGGGGGFGVVCCFVNVCICVLSLALHSPFHHLPATPRLSLLSCITCPFHLLRCCCQCRGSGGGCHTSSCHPCCRQQRLQRSDAVLAAPAEGERKWCCVVSCVRACVLSGKQSDTHAHTHRSAHRSAHRSGVPSSCASALARRQVLNWMPSSHTDINSEKPPLYLLPTHLLLQATD